MTNKVKYRELKLEIKDAISLINKLDIPQMEKIIEQMEICHEQYDHIRFYNDDVTIDDNIWSNIID